MYAHHQYRTQSIYRGHDGYGLNTFIALVIA